jgi:hypothetical protein
LRRIGVVFALALAACGGDGDATTAEESPSSTASTSPSPTAVVEDFHTEWWGAVLPYTRLVSGEVLLQGARILRGLDDAVDRLDSLSVALADAGLDDAAASARTLADAIDEQADVASQKAIPTPKGLADELHEQVVAARAVVRALGAGADVMGRC